MRRYGAGPSARQFAWMMRHVRPCARALAEARGRHLEGTGLGLPAWGVLEMLADFGPQTVPGLARRLGQRRQSVQPLADALAARGLAELCPNAAHRRSKLLRLTEPGRALADAVRAREAAFDAAMADRFLAEDVHVTRRTLANLFYAYTGKRAWEDSWLCAGYESLYPDAGDPPSGELRRRTA